MKEEIRELVKVGDKMFKVAFQVYESMDEAAKAAGDVAVPLRRLNDHLLYHGAFGPGRELIAECVQEVTKVPFLTTTVKNAEGKDVVERDWDKDSDAKYAARAIALKPDQFDAVQKLIDSRARGYKAKDAKGVEIMVPALAVNIKAKVRTGPAARVLAQKFKAIALEFLSGKKNLEKFLAVVTKQEIGSFTPAKDKDGKALPLTAEENVTALGWLCKSWSDAQDVFKSVS